MISTSGNQGGGAVNIWRANIDGTNLARLSNGKRDVAPACSIDSKTAYYIDASEAEVKRVSLDGGPSEVLPGTEVSHGFVDQRFLLDRSPDGRQLAVLFLICETTATHKIGLIPLESGAQPEVRFLEPNSAVADGSRYTPDGKALVYPITQAGVDNVWLQPLDGSPGRQITNFKSDHIIGLEWSPDGKRLAVLQRRTEADVVLLRESK